MSFDRTPASPIASQDAGESKDGQLHRHSTNLTSPISGLESWAVRLPQAYVLPVSGGIAGAVSGLVSCPLDVIKTKLQAQGGFQVAKDGLNVRTSAYHGVQGTAGMIWKEEGIKGLYRGLGPMLLGYVPTWAVYLTVYNKAQTFFRTKTGRQ